MYHTPLSLHPCADGIYYHNLLTVAHHNIKRTRAMGDELLITSMNETSVQGRERRRRPQTSTTGRMIRLQWLGIQ